MTQASEMQTQYILSVLSNLEGKEPGPTPTPDEIAMNILEQIETGLSSAPFFIGRWDVVWGPGIFMSGGKDCLDSEPDGRDCLDQVMYVAYNENQNKYSICIAGTKSDYGWRELNFKVNVDDMVPWKWAPSADAKIAEGTWVGLQNLLEMTATDGVPGAGTTLEQFLNESIKDCKEVEIVTNGISLGGALSPTLGLWLQDTQTWAEFPNVAISTWAFAGPTTGNQAFKEYSDSRLPDTNRVANDLDVVPHAWEYESLNEVPSLYKRYNIPVLPSVRLLVRMAKKRTGEDVYQHVGQEHNTHILEGVFNEDKMGEECSSIPSKDLCDFVNQMAYQHVGGYWGILDGPREFDSVVEQVQEQFNKQVQAHLPELMEYANSQ